MFTEEYNKLKELLASVMPVNYNSDNLKTRNLISKSITLDISEGVPVIANGKLRASINIALNELDYILSIDQSIFITQGMLHSDSQLNKSIVTDTDYETFCMDLTDEYLKHIVKENYVGDVGFHNSQYYRMVMRTVPLTFYDINVPLSKDYIGKLAQNLPNDETYKNIKNEEDKKEYLSKIEMKAREAFIDPLTEIVHSLNKSINTPMVLSLYNINTKTLPGSLKGTMAFIGRSESIYNITQIEFLNLDNTLHLNFNMLEMNLSNTPLHDLFVMSSLLIGIANITNKKLGTVTANISRVYMNEMVKTKSDELEFVHLEINNKLNDISEINSRCFSYEIK